MKSTSLASLPARLASLIVLFLPLQAVAEWVVMRDCRLVASDGNDGDSFHFSYDGREYIARLYFVDCAETNDQVPDRIVQQMEAFGVPRDKVYRYGHEAKKFTERVLARPFTVVTRFQDARGRSRLPRHYAFVFPNGSRSDLGSLLTNAGLARSFGQRARNDLRLDRAHYDRLEAEARRQRRGIFGGNRSTRFADEPRQKDRPAPTKGPSTKTSRRPLDPMVALIDLLQANLRASNDALVQAVGGHAGKPVEPPAGRRINVNTASRGELESLPGIGGVMSRRIIENRPYSSIGDLRRVPRVGEAAIKRLAPLVEF